MVVDRRRRHMLRSDEMGCAIEAPHCESALRVLILRDDGDAAARG
jgi:hypothetical protein